MLCEHQGTKYYSSCCKQIICSECCCCQKPNKIEIPVTTPSLCSRCDISQAQQQCDVCNFIYCSQCFQQIHDIGKFQGHTYKNLIQQELHHEITKQCNIIQSFEKYATEQQASIVKYFDQIYEVLDKKKQQLIGLVINYRKGQLNLLTSRLAVIEAAVNINSLQTIEIPTALNYETKQFTLSSKVQLLESILNIDIVNISESNAVSPRRTHTQQSVQRSSSCRKLEPQEKVVEQCETFERRKIYKTICQSNSIKLFWTYCVEKVDYLLELGIGMKVKGVEQFKQIYRGPEPNYIIIGLQPKTNYKFRVIAEFNNNASELSEVLNVFTLPQQSIEESLIVSKRNMNNDVQVQFEKPGLILGTNPLHFGIWTWEIKLIINGIIEDLTASLVVGVANKQRRIIGTTLNYGYQRESLMIKVQVDMDNKCMTITSKMHPQGERFLSLVGPLYPAFQNKNTHKGSGCKLLISYYQQ